MVILAHIDIIERYFKADKNKQKLFSIFYNSSIELCFSKGYIEEIERDISNKEAFQALIKELYDTNRLKLEKTNNERDVSDEFTEIAKKAHYPLFFPIKYQNCDLLSKELPSLIIVEKASPINKHWITIELLSKNFCNVCYQNFRSDDEIKAFFDDLLSMPKFITSLSVFDREQNAFLLSKAKGKNIKYYTYLNRGGRNELSRKVAKTELKNILGGRLRLYYTSNPRLLHERKIIFENIILTFDNSANNITINEPTWEILISYDRDKALKWLEKCGLFLEVHD